MLRATLEDEKEAWIKMSVMHRGSRQDPGGKGDGRGFVRGDYGPGGEVGVADPDRQSSRNSEEEGGMVPGH